MRVMDKCLSKWNQKDIDLNDKLDKYYVSNMEEEIWNGEYIESEVKFKDNDTKSYVKDKNHHLFKLLGIWRLGKSGFDVSHSFDNLENKIYFNKEKKIY